MKPMNILLMSGLCLFLLAFMPRPNSVQFYDGPYFSAKELAASTGKLYMIDFTAEWCLPCKWMEENTFSHDALKNYIDEHVVPVKVDIDDFDGFVLKEQYAVEVLPTILIFNSQGEVIKRIEESVSGETLLSALQAVNVPKNRIVSQPSIASTVQPQENAYTENSILAPETPEILKAPVRPTFPTAIAEETTETTIGFTTPEQEATPANEKVEESPIWFSEPSAPKPVAKPDYIVPSENAPVINTVHSEHTENDDFMSGYFVQIGSFTEYSNALQRQNEIQARCNKDVVIRTLNGKGQTNYKVLIGLYNSYEAAAYDLPEIKSLAYGAFIKKY